MNVKQHNERSALLASNQRWKGDDGRRDIGPYQDKHDQPEAVGCFGAVIGLVITGTVIWGFLYMGFHLLMAVMSHIHWPRGQHPLPGSGQQPPGLELPPYVWKVAVIGAGPGGSSAAYNVWNYAQDRGIRVEITVYEKNDYVGGRSTCMVDVGDNLNVQIAAKGFRPSNTKLVDAAKKFGLPIVMLDAEQNNVRSGERWGVYDGSNFVIHQTNPTDILSSWWQSAKLFYIYGHSLRNTRSLVTKTASKFSRIYSPKFFPFNSLSAVLKELALEEETSSTAHEILSANGVQTDFQKDLVTAWTRREYGQNLGQISGFAMTLTPDDADDMTVAGGHEALFKKMMKASHANLMLNTTAYGVRKMDWGGWIVASQASRDSWDDDLDYQEFDSVVLAAPLQFAVLEVKGGRLTNFPEKLEYAAVHVTLFRSPRKLSPDYFRLHDAVPETVLTTLQSDEFDVVSGRTGKRGVGRAGFYSVTSLKRMKTKFQGRDVGEFLYKIVSPEKIEEEKIYDILGANELEDDAISWVYRHEFPAAYPYNYPRTYFSETELEGNFWYTSGIEELGSSLELSTLMGDNVARLVVDSWMRGGKRGKRPPLPTAEMGGGKDSEEMTNLSSGEYLKRKYEGVI